MVYPFSLRYQYNTAKMNGGDETELQKQKEISIFSLRLSNITKDLISHYRDISRDIL